jgi:hypothetical protein
MIWVSIISYGEIRFDIRVLWITSTFPERIMLANQGTTVHRIPGGALLCSYCAPLRSVYKRHFCKTQNVLNKTTEIPIPAAR